MKLARGQTCSFKRNLVLREFEKGVLTRLVFADAYDAEKERFSRVTMQEFEDGRLVRITEAASARWDESAWLFEDGISYNVVDGDRVVSVRFARQEGRIAYTPKEVARGGLSPDEMSASELRQHTSAERARPRRDKASGGVLFVSPSRLRAWYSVL